MYGTIGGCRYAEGQLFSQQQIKISIVNYQSKLCRKMFVV